MPSTSEAYWALLLLCLLRACERLEGCPKVMALLQRPNCAARQRDAMEGRILGDSAHWILPWLGLGLRACRPGVLPSVMRLQERPF